MPTCIPHQKFRFYHLPTRGRAGIKLGDAWYVSNVSIIFDAPCYIIFCFGHYWALLYTFILFLGLTYKSEAQPRIAVVCLFQSFAEKEYQMESKRNETFGNVIFGTNVIQRTWSPRKKATRRARGRGRAYPPGRALHPRGAHVAPPTYFFLLYIPTYPQTIRGIHENLIPPPQPSVPVRSHLGAFFGVLPEGALITEGFYINTIASPMMCE